MLRKSFLKTTFLFGQLHARDAYYLAELLTPATKMCWQFHLQMTLSSTWHVQDNIP